MSKISPSSQSDHIHHHRHPGYSYPVHIRSRIYGLVGVPLLVVLVAYLVIHQAPSTTGGQVSVVLLLEALAASMIRLLTAYIVAVVLALPMALLINHSSLTERILLPMFDILQSVPVLAFFPVIIIFFLNYHLLEGAAIFVLIISMLWSIVFSLVGGLRLVPGDVKAAAQIFGIRRTAYVREVLIPSIFPYFVTGSLLSWASGWNILIVAEVLHTYLPHGNRNSDLFGIGSLMVHASADGNGNLFIAAILTLVVAIAIINLTVWQRLLHYAERFRFE
ncbi:MAG TPA: ABC transporter permease subunit [Candidatus Saccharimonadales bacterium]|jgi:NitT/TauT family transport system permease protein|nr:ABC transporter permease subunit [Candidatus Saccharimonadales bacterium]